MGPRAGLDGCGKSRPRPGFYPRTVQPVASRYTDCTIPAHVRCWYVPIFLWGQGGREGTEIPEKIISHGLFLEQDGTRFAKSIFTFSTSHVHMWSHRQ